MNRSSRAPLPINDDEAIVIAFVVWNTNLYPANSPLLEFYNISQQFNQTRSRDLRKLEFVDTKIKNLAQLNIDCLSNKVYFYRDFPKELYNHNILQNLARKNKIKISRGDIYDRLYFLSLLELFYYGKLPEAVENVTFIDRDEINEISNEKVLSYGVIGEKVYYITLSELTRTFQNNKNFGNPFVPNEILSKRAIKSLKGICKEIQESSNSFSNETIEESRALIRSMDFVSVISTEKYQDVSNFLRTYRAFDSTTKEIILKCLIILLETGMYMRTWRGPGEEYPLNECPIDDQDRIDVNVLTSIGSFNEQCDQLEEQLNMKSLPLFKFSKVNNEFEISTDTFNGLNIGERLEILLRGENEHRMSSCMRMTSNWIVSTAYYYLNSIGKQPDFNITDLKMIA